MRLGDHARNRQAEAEAVARRARREERLDGLAQDVRRHAFAAVGDGDPAGGAGGPLDPRQLGDDDRSRRGRVPGVGQQMRDGRLELPRIDQDGPTDAEPQFEDPIGTERVLEQRQPVGERLVRVEALHARRTDPREGLQLPGEPDPALETGARHPDDGAARRGRVGETVDAVGEDLQDVGELVTDDRGDATERLDVPHPVEPLGADLRIRRPQPCGKSG